MDATFAKAAYVLLIALFGTLMLAAVAAIGILGIRSAARQGNVIAGDELTTAVVTGQLARDMDVAYPVGEAVVRSADPAMRSRLLGTLYTSLVPAVDGHLAVAGTAARRRSAGRTRRRGPVHPAVECRP